MVLHGETAIWRCYSGKRFSEDLDFYSSTFPGLTKQFEKIGLSQGLSITKMKDAGNVIFSTISNGRARVKLEINHSRKIDGSLTTYELADGTEIEILSLTPDQFIEEKIAEYTDRRFVRGSFIIVNQPQIY